MIGGQTLAPGGLAIIISNTPISLAADAADAVVGSSTITIVRPASPATASPANATVLTIGKSVYTADASSNFVIGGQTLTPDTAITLAGIPVNLAPSRTQAVVGGRTIALYPAVITAAPDPGHVLVLTFGGSSYSADSNGQYVIGSQTLAPGAAITVSGTATSLASGGNVATVGTST